MLRVGEYASPDGVVTITPERLKHWETQHARLSQRYAVPMDWDHADTPADAMPVNLSAYKRSSRNTVGRMKDFKVGQDGQSAEIVMEIHDVDAQRKADDNTVYVSPVIFESFTDGAGERYEDVITHLDIVSYPVDYSQTGFAPLVEAGDCVACGIRMGLQSSPGFFRLGKPVDDEEDDEDDDEDYLDDSDEEEVEDEEYVEDFDEIDGEETDEGDDESEDELDESDDLDEFSEDEEEDEVEDDFEGDDEVEDDDLLDFEGDDEGGMDDVAIQEEADAAERAARERATQLAQQKLSEEEMLADVMVNLKHAGIAPPEGVDAREDPIGFLSQLAAAVRQKLLSEKGDDDEDDDEFDFGDDDDDEENKDDEIMVKTPEYAQMSLRQKDAERRIKAYEAAMVKREREAKRLSLDSLLTSGRITAAEHEKYAGKLSTVRMSLSDDGQIGATSIDDFIESRQAIPEGTMWPADERAKRLGVHVERKPSEYTQEVGPEEAKAYVDAQAARNPGMMTS